MKRLFEDRYEEDVDEGANFQESKENQEQKSFAAIMNEKLLSASRKRPRISDSFQKELNLYDSGGPETENIKLLRSAINNIQASSSEAERTFSICGKFCTKIRSRLSDSTLNMLVYLKNIFKK